uniref:Secreted protein n=1 Tax=Trichobilharzia regenti TaxID=157069 RepID=A0AA85ITA9_TRIRE|nr:unnamed protein product [Trichobilharzia regenti]
MSHVLIILLTVCIVFSGIVFGGGSNQKSCDDLKKEIQTLLTNASTCKKVAAEKIVHYTDGKRQGQPPDDLPKCSNVRDLMNISGIPEVKTVPKT